MPQSETVCCKCCRKLQPWAAYQLVQSQHRFSSHITYLPSCIATNETGVSNWKDTRIVENPPASFCADRRCWQFRHPKAPEQSTVKFLTPSRNAVTHNIRFQNLRIWS